MRDVDDLLRERRIPVWPRRGALALRAASATVLLIAVLATLRLTGTAAFPLEAAPATPRDGQAIGESDDAGRTHAELVAGLLGTGGPPGAIDSGGTTFRLQTLVVEARRGAPLVRDVRLRIEIVAAGRSEQADPLAALAEFGLRDLRTVRTAPTPDGISLDVTGTMMLATGPRGQVAASMPNDGRSASGPATDDPVLVLAGIIGEQGLELTTARAGKVSGGSLLVAELTGAATDVAGLVLRLEEAFSAPARISLLRLAPSGRSTGWDMVLELTPRSSTTRPRAADGTTS